MSGEYTNKELTVLVDKGTIIMSNIINYLVDKHGDEFGAILNWDQKVPSTKK